MKFSCFCGRVDGTETKEGLLAMQRGKFIVFEGIDGSGKSTQIKLLANYLREKGVSVYTTCEPTDGPIGSVLHQCMTGRIPSDEKTIAALFVADRLDHLNNPVNGILSKIEAGITVLSDRYYLSSYAYNGAHVSLDWVIQANAMCAELLRPDINIYIDIDPQVSLGRVSRRGSTERYEKLDNMERVRKKYFELFERLGKEEKIAVVQSRREVQETAKKIREVADELFGF